jgi:hypothetical protein
VGEWKFFGPNFVKEAEERVEVIKENIKATQMRQKSYHDKGKAVREYQVGEKVYLRVSPTKGVQRFEVKGKLAPRYIGPYEITESCGPVAYRIRLPERFVAVHNVFHVSQRIEINSPAVGASTLYLPLRESMDPSAYVSIATKLEEISVVCDYPDVFADNLSGL